MTDVLSAILVLLRLPPGRFRDFLLYVGQPLIIVSLLILAYAAQNMVRERSVSAGLMATFINSNLTMADHRRDAEAAQLQAELVIEARVTRLIEGRINKLLDINPPTARVRVATLHNGIIGLAGNSKPRADVSYAVARPGRATGGMSVNLPISSLASFSDEMFGGACIIRDVKALAETPGKEHLKSFGARRFVSCPASFEGRLLGIVTIYWDDSDLLPTTEEEARITLILHNEALEIGSNLAMRQNE